MTLHAQARDVVAQDHEVRRGAVKQPERDTREARMRERTLAFDDHPVGALGRIADEHFGRAGDEVGDDRVHRDPCTCDRDPGLSRRDELDALARTTQGRRDLERRGHLPDRGIRTDGEDYARPFARPAMAADRQIRRRLAKLAHGAAPAFRGGSEPGVREHALVQTVPDREAALQGASEGGPISIWDAAAGGRGPDQHDRGSACDRVVHARDDGYSRTDADAFRRVPSGACRIDHGDDLEWRVPEHADRGLRGGRRELALCEDRDLHRPPRSGPRRRKRPCRSRVVSPSARATPPFTMTCSSPIG